MNVEEAWDAFIKSESVKKASIDEKLDVLASQMNEVQTTVDRLAETIPEAQGDAGAMEMANDAAMTEPNPEEALGEVAGAPEEEGVAAPAGEGGGEDIPPGDEGDIGGGLGLTEDDLADETPVGGEEGLPDEGMSEGSEMPPVPEGGDMGIPAEGESNDIISMVKDMIASETDPGKLAQLSKILTAAVGTQTPQVGQSFEEPDFSGEGSEMQMMKSGAIAKKGEGTGVVGEKSTVDTGGKNMGGKDPTTEAPGAATAEAGTDRPLQDAPVAESASVDGPTPELMKKIMDAVKGALVEYYGEGSEGDIDESAEEAAQDGEEVKIDDEDANTHIDVEDGGKVEVEGKEFDDDGDAVEISEEEKIGRNDELGGDESSPFADSCINKSFADMLHGRIAQTVGVDGQFAKGTVAKGYDDYNDYQNSIESKYLDEDESKTLNALRNKKKTPAQEDNSVSCTPSEVNTVVGDAGMTGSNSTVAESNCAKTEDSKGSKKTERLIGYTTDDPDDPEAGEVWEEVDESNCTKSASDNGKPIMSLKDMMAIQKSADRMDIATTMNGSLTPPSLDGAAPIKMTSIREMMGNGNSIRKSIEHDADAYRLYKSQQNM